MSERSSLDAMNSSRVNALRASVNRHSDSLSRLLLSSKETLVKRTAIEAAFRTCRNAFMEVSAVLINLLDERSTTANLSPGDVKKAVVEVLDDLGGRHISGGKINNVGCREGVQNPGGRSYASVAGSLGSEVRVLRGPTVEISNTTSFLIVPKENAREKFVSSQATRETLYKVLKPADCGLRVKRLSRAQDCGIRIEAFAPDIEKIRAHPGFVSAGLEVREYQAEPSAYCAWRSCRNVG